MVVFEHITVGGKQDGDEKAWVEKIAELGRRRWRDQNVDEIFGTMMYDGCHYGQHPKVEKKGEILVTEISRLTLVD